MKILSIDNFTTKLLRRWMTFSFLTQSCWTINQNEKWKFISNLYYNGAWKVSSKFKLFSCLKWVGLKPSLSIQWSLVQSFAWDSVCISFVQLTSLWEQIHTELMQKKSCMKLRTRTRGKLHCTQTPALDLLAIWTKLHSSPNNHFKDLAYF